VRSSSSVPTTEYPETTDALDAAESAFLLAARLWVAIRQQNGNPPVRLRAALASVGAEAAAFPLDRFMTLAARSTRRRVVTYCPCTPQLGQDEKQLLHSASLVQNGESELASWVLQTTILTTEGAVLALGPLEELGEQFAQSKLLFRRRKMPVAESAFPATVESWISSLSGTTLH
jgi:hypothetical protein